MGHSRNGTLEGSGGLRAEDAGTMAQREGGKVSQDDVPEDQDVSGGWTKDRADAVLKEIGIDGVLDEPESPLSRFYVTESFAGYGDPLEPFGEKLARVEGDALKERLRALALQEARRLHQDEQAATKSRCVLELPSKSACRTAFALTARWFLRACRLKTR